MGNASAKDRRGGKRARKGQASGAEKEEVASRGRKVSQFLSKSELKKLERHTKYTADELKDLHTRFGFDSKNELTQKQLVAVLAQRFHIDLSNSFILKRLFDIFDVDNSGSVDFKEFAEAMGIIERGTDDEKVEFVFRLCDLDGNGEIDRDEFKTIVEKIYENKEAQAILHFALDEAEIKRMGGIDAFVDDFFVEADVDHDGSVSFPEYKRVMIAKRVFKQLHLTESELSSLFVSKKGSSKTIFIVGPPCCGKGRLSAEIQKHFGTRVVGVNRLVQRATFKVAQKEAMSRTKSEAKLTQLGMNSLGVTQLTLSGAVKLSESATISVDSPPISRSARVLDRPSARHVDIGSRAKSFTDTDQDLPDDMVYGIVSTHIEALEARRRHHDESTTEESGYGSDGSGTSERRSYARGWLIHGFPRTPGQMLLLNQGGIIPDKIIVLKCASDAVLSARLEEKIRRIQETSGTPVPETDLVVLRSRFQRRIRAWRESREQLIRLVGAENDGVSQVFDLLDDTNADDAPESARSESGNDSNASSPALPSTESKSILLDTQDPRAPKSIVARICAFIEEGDVAESLSDDGSYSW